MINFTDLPTRNKFYAGANGAKRAVIYQGEQYMLKFPAQAPKNKDLSYPQADEAIMRDTIDKQPERDFRTFSIPLSSIKVNGKKINYFDFISSLEDADCNKALKRILPKINMDAIFRIVNETPFISDLQKQFYKTMLRTRKELILDFAMEKLRKREKAKELEAR